MNLLSNTNATPKAMLWTGWVLSGLIVLLFLFGGVMTLIKPPDEQFDKFGYDRNVLPFLGITMIVCALVYAVPQTSVLGAILLTGYLGGAVATHVRIHDVFFVPIIVGVLVWVAIFLRDGRLRALVPLRR